jgi:hypothetical protein
MIGSVQRDVYEYTRRVEMGPLLQRETQISWLRRLEEKLRGVYAAITCTRTSDVLPHRAAHRPPRSASHRQEPHRQVTPPSSSYILHRQEPTPRPPPSHQAGGSSWHHQPSFEYGGSSQFEQPFSQPGGDSQQQAWDPIHGGWTGMCYLYLPATKLL